MKHKSEQAVVKCKAQEVVEMKDWSINVLNVVSREVPPMTSPLHQPICSASTSQSSNHYQCFASISLLSSNFIDYNLFHLRQVGKNKGTKEKSIRLL